MACIAFEGNRRKKRLNMNYPATSKSDALLHIEHYAVVDTVPVRIFTETAYPERKSLNFHLYLGADFREFKL
jgi:hypothetical protein